MRFVHVHVSMWVALVGNAVPASAAEEEPPSPTALLFGKKCGGCHTIGEGDRTGPDLLAVTKRRDERWLRTFIRDPGSVIDGGDKVASDLLVKFKGVRMPEQVLTPDQLSDLIAYLADCGAKGGCKVALGKVRHASQAKAADVARGKRLFQGLDRLSGGGPACMSCHDVRNVGPLGGGTLAKDLTFAYARLGDAPISAALADTPFPLMKDIFPAHPLRADEAFAIKAYLAAAAKGGPPALDHDFAYAGVIGLFLALGAVGALWRRAGAGPSAGADIRRRNGRKGTP